ncbi:MAG: GNAT family N-acetyltransferase [Pseudomonadota bacterium]
MALVWTDCLAACDWDELSTLYKLAPLGEKPAASLKLAFANSMFRCFVHDEGRLVAVGRALADGVDCAYICDLAVHPDYQGAGLGRDVVARLVDASRGHKKIILYAVAGSEPFYTKLGFKRMTTAMAIFSNETQAFERGLISQSDAP